MKRSQDHQGRIGIVYSGPKLERGFYARPAEQVARELLGKVLVHYENGRMRRSRIVETEAYVGVHDLACHASKGRTRRTEVMFGRGGHAYVYLIYGMYEMFNIVTSMEGDAQAVLIRGARGLDGWGADLLGPGKLARGMRITRRLNGADLTGDELFVMEGDAPPPRIGTTARVGVEYARHWKDALLRFYDEASVRISKTGKACLIVAVLLFAFLI